jgi:hypothetical protein
MAFSTKARTINCNAMKGRVASKSNIFFTNSGQAFFY